MASFNKFRSFVEAVAEKTHNLGSDTLKLALTNTAPTNTDTVFDPGSLHPPPAAANGYTSGGHTTAQQSSAQTAGTYKLVLTDTVITATAGGIGPFRYVILYNDTAASNELIGWWDYASSITLADGETFTINLDDSGGVLTIA
jgi:hypothetical protein